jgi:4-amino-4-deoxy-L-arabinose transferase-like glycosyltransferase
MRCRILAQVIALRLVCRKGTCKSGPCSGVTSDSCISSGAADNEYIYMPLVIPGNSRRRSLLWLMGLALLLAFAFQGSRGLWNTDEGRYVDGALQMLDSGNFLVPAYSPVAVNLSKPPMTYWVIAASLKVFGRSTWATRVPSALAYLVTVLLVYAIGLRLFAHKPWLSGWVFALSLAPFIAANVVSTDVLLMLFEALAMYAYVAHATDPDARRARALLVLMWLGWGLAFLTKGPPGLLPLLAVILYEVLRNGWRGVGRLFAPVGILVFLAVGLGWYMVVILRVPWALHYLLHYEVYDRIFTSVQHRNAGTWGWLIIYFPTLVLGSLPWWPIAISPLLKRSSRLDSKLPSLRHLAMTSPWRRVVQMSRGQAGPMVLLWLWFAIPLIFFCAARSRLPAYVLPLFLPLSLLMAASLEGLVDLRRPAQTLLLAAWVIVLLGIKAGAAYGIHAAGDNRRAAARLGAMAGSESYSSLVFVHATKSSYDIEERTPWGVRLYLGKPVYAVAWFAQAGPAQLCRALRRSGSALVVMDSGLHFGPVLGSLSRCTPTRVNALGHWQRYAVAWVRS